MGRAPDYPPWRFVGDINQFVRSAWEELVCHFLRTNNLPYKHKEIHYYGSMNERKLSWLPELVIKDYAVEITGVFYHRHTEKYAAIIKTNRLKVVMITLRRYFEKAKQITDLIVSFYDLGKELPRAC